MAYLPGRISFDHSARDGRMIAWATSTRVRPMSPKRSVAERGKGGVVAATSPPLAGSAPRLVAAANPSAV